MNPFVHYRERLESWAAVNEGVLDDGAFVELVEALDAQVAAVDGHGFSITPLVRADELAQAIGLDGELWIKDETNSVAGSHKARHLFGLALHLLVDERRGQEAKSRLAIASCGNAALAAGVVAAALDRSLEVSVPTWADDGIVARLESLGASVARCERRAGEVGDPAYLRFSEAVAAGAEPFCVQGTDAPATFDGGRTLGWEVADQLPPPDHHASDLAGGNEDLLFLQVGGGAMATAFSQGWPSARLFPVQAEGCAPLRRAWDRLLPGLDLASAAADPQRYMWAWETEPTSAATGILDDVTYDWLPLLERTAATGGEPIVAPESLIVEANRLARTHTDLKVSTTGSAGLAGVLSLLAHPERAAVLRGQRVVVAFTGRGGG